MMKRITIYDVAKEADVSLATVSRVINGSEVVREDTRVKKPLKNSDTSQMRLRKGWLYRKQQPLHWLFRKQVFSIQVK